jgi:enterochelin esterase-like enzyme
MGPEDTSTLVLAIFLAIGAVVGCLLLWARMPGPGPLKTLGRIGMIFLCQVTALFMIFIAINIQRTFYSTWNDLAFDLGIGSDPNGGNQGGIVGGPGASGGGQSQTGGQPQQIRANFKFHSDTKTYKATIKGPASGITADVDVWTPPGYDPKGNTQYPVVELFSGTPGTPIAWFGSGSMIEVGKKAGGMMKDGRIKPFVMVSVTINVVNSKPNECTDVPGEPKVATWLTKDMHTLMTEWFHAKDDPKSWAMMGYSEGAYCAVKLALQFPKLYHVGVGIAGTYQPDLSMVSGSTAEVTATSPFNLVRAKPPVNLLLATTYADRESPVSAAQSLGAAIRPPTRVEYELKQRGGHLTSIWGTMMPQILPWLSQHLE